MKIDRLIEKTTEKDGVKKWKVVVGIVVGLGIVFAFWSFTIPPLVEEYLLSTNGRVATNVVEYDFYNQKISESDGTELNVYFFGSSIIQNSIAPSEINNILSECGYDNIRAYDLGLSGDRPESRLLQLDKVIESKPALVVYGISYITLTYEIWMDEYVALVNNQISLDSDAYYIYSSDELEKIYRLSPITTDKTYIESALNYISSTSPDERDIASNGLNAGAWRQITGDGEYFSSSLIRVPAHEWRFSMLENPSYPWMPTFTDDSNREKEAFQYIIQKLDDAGIPVVVVNMPLNPLLSEKITDESRKNFSEFLNQTGVVWYDYEYLFGEEYFADTHHMWSIHGRDNFSPFMADLIIQEMS